MDLNKANHIFFSNIIIEALHNVRCTWPVILVTWTLTGSPQFLNCTSNVDSAQVIYAIKETVHYCQKATRVSHVANLCALLQAVTATEY